MHFAPMVTRWRIFPRISTACWGRSNQTITPRSAPSSCAGFAAVDAGRRPPASGGAVLLDEVLVRGHRRCASTNDFPDVGQVVADKLLVEYPGQRIIAFRHDVLADHDVQPALGRKQLMVLAQDAAMAAEEIDSLLETVRLLEVAAVGPQL